jgi:hypothetical protein
VLPDANAVQVLAHGGNYGVTDKDSLFTSIVVKINILRPDMTFKTCSGLLVGNGSYVLSAKHCFFDDNSRNYALVKPIDIVVIIYRDPPALPGYFGNDIYIDINGALNNRPRHLMLSPEDGKIISERARVNKIIPLDNFTADYPNTKHDFALLKLSKVPDFIKKYPNTQSSLFKATPWKGIAQKTANLNLFAYVQRYGYGYVFGDLSSPNTRLQNRYFVHEKEIQSFLNPNSLENYPDNAPYIWKNNAVGEYHKNRSNANTIPEFRQYFLPASGDAGGPVFLYEDPKNPTSRKILVGVMANQIPDSCKTKSDKGESDMLFMTQFFDQETAYWFNSILEYEDISD